MFCRHRRAARWTALMVAVALGSTGCGDGPSVDDAIGADGPTTTVSVPATSAAPATTTTNTAASTVAPSTSVEVPTTTLVPTTTAPDAPAVLTPPPAVPLGFALVDQRAADGFSLAVPGDYLAVDIGGDLVAQADAAAVDTAGRAALDAFAVSRGQGDFRLAAFRFNTGSDHTDNVLVVRYADPAGEAGTAQLEEIYRSGFIDPGGSVFASDVTTIAGRPAVVMEGERLVGGQILSRQWVGLVVGDGEVWEIVVTLGLPVDDADGVVARQVIGSFALTT